MQNIQGLEELIPQNLGQFNLILGDNNTGKTSLLNALALHPSKQASSGILVQSYSDLIHKQGKLVQRKFVEKLRTFVPNIETIVVDGKEILLKEKDDKSAPLFQYGKGTNRLFEILLQMELNKGGKIAIDEIDIGIHFCHLTEVWKILIQLAQENNIQLFATTHNLECIQYFSEALEELAETKHVTLDLARTITLYQTQKGDVKARIRSFEAFSEAIKEGYNIRGGE
jgi:AAA15 family ATPase/GTPase